MELLQMIVGETRKAMDFGDGNRVITIPDDISMKTYNEYKEKLALQGFSLYADNSDALPIATYVRTATYVKDNTFFTVTHMINTKTTYLSYCKDIALSPHLKFDKEYVKDNVEGAKTTLHNLEMFWFGNSLIIQLKNGHFIISDGGLDNREAYLSDGEYLLQYLESLAPAGEKPIVEAWTISHLHVDHCGLMRDFASGILDAERLYVEGIYYSQPNEDVFELTAADRKDAISVKEAAKRLKRVDGSYTELYRIQTGQRYYFNDITMDIVLSQEQLPLEQYANVESPEDSSKRNLNDSSTWYMFTIEGQKVLFIGDADKGAMDFVMNAYSKEYLTLTGITTQHHSWNPYMPFAEYIETEAVIVTSDELCTSEYIAELRPDLPEKVEWYAPNSVLKKKAKEVVEWGKGTVIMTFPYKPNNLKVLEKKKRRED